MCHCVECVECEKSISSTMLTNINKEELVQKIKFVSMLHGYGYGNTNS